MRITKFGHACLLVEERSTRILIDPGAYSKGFESLTQLNAIFITHCHQDHFLPDALAQLLVANPGVKVYADEKSAGLAAKEMSVQAVHEGDRFEVSGVTVRVIGSQHAVAHADVPIDPNVGYLIAGRFFYPGDALTVPGDPVEILAIPAGAPWQKVGEAIDYIRAVKPKFAIPVHDAVLSDEGKDIYKMMLEQLKDPDTQLRIVPDGQPTEV